MLHSRLFEDLLGSQCEPIAYLYLVSNYRKQCLFYLMVYDMWLPHFLISKRVFHLFLLNYTDFKLATYHTSNILCLKYDSTTLPKSPYVKCLKKIGIRL